MYDRAKPQRPLLNLFSEKDLDEIHSASLEILERTGVRIYHEEAISLLRSAGAYIEDDTLVKIPNDVVTAAIDSSPDRVVLSNRLGERKLFLEGTKSYFGTGSDLVNTIDHETGEHRKSSLEDIENAALVADYLGNIDFIMSYAIPHNVPPLVQGLESFYGMMRNSIKPLVITASSGRKDILEKMHAIGAEVAGGVEELKKSPFFVVYNEPVAPLKHSKECMEILLYCSRHRIPVLYPPVVQAGLSGTSTMAGSIAQGNAESLAGLVVTQLNNPGSPFVAGSGGVTPFDMKNSAFPYGAPEWHMADIVYSQLARRYRLPSWNIAGCSDSKTPDQQAAIEGAQSILMSALGGGNLIHDIGYLNSGLTGNLDFLVMMDETISMTKRVLQGFEVNSETLGLDVIDQVRPGGNFLTEDHTLDHFRQVGWIPELFNRKSYEEWENKGSKTMAQLANEKTKEILYSHKPKPLSEATKKEIESIIHSVKKIANV